jgi:hypothetical protein
MTNKISTHMIFVGVEFVLAVLTLIPREAASKACLLGYKALCSFTPISTLGLLALVGLHLFLHYGKPAFETYSSGTVQERTSLEKKQGS